MKTIKPSLLVSTGLVGLALAMTGCTTMSQSPHNGVVGQHKDSMMGRERMGDHHGKMGFWHKGNKDGKMNRGFDNLNLTDAQKAQLQQLRSQNQARMQQMHNSLQQMEANIDAQKKAGASTATLLGLYQQKQSLMNQAMALHQQQQQQFMSILTPEQQLKFYEKQRIPMMKHDEHRMQPNMQPPMQPMPNGQMPPRTN